MFFMGHYVGPEQKSLPHGLSAKSSFRSSHF